MPDRSKLIGNEIENIQRIDEKLDAVKIYSIISIPVTLSALTNASELLTDLVLGYAGKIEKVQYVAQAAATTASKDANFRPKIGATAVTGGVVSLTTATANVKGLVASGTAITNLNSFTATDAISIVCGSPTAIFVEGTGTVILTVSQAIA